MPAPPPVSAARTAMRTGIPQQHTHNGRVSEPLFVIPLWADLIAVGLGGVQGALFASGFRGQRRLDLLGVAIIGIVMGMGGGLIRDLLLNVTPVTLQSNWYLLTATGAALIGMLLAGLFQRLNAVIVGLDALVIGLFGAFGTSKALALGLPPVPAVFVGVCSAVGGGILRDMIMGLPVAIMHVGSLYAVAAAAGCVVLATTEAFGLPLVVAAVIGVVVTTVIRLLAVIFDISLPEQRALYRRKVAVETSAIPTVKP
ncbi:trimeric intracellular cation channel family protein [Microbacterium deminutum]|uniref:Trimeric intracellular cation channel family protein n=1 Tax=Microbacterium deminutum TaxID=344164 RepID=A0ABN2QJW1_9MICO